MKVLGGVNGIRETPAIGGLRMAGGTVGLEVGKRTRTTREQREEQ